MHERPLVGEPAKEHRGRRSFEEPQRHEDSEGSGVLRGVAAIEVREGPLERPRQRLGLAKTFVHRPGKAPRQNASGLFLELFDFPLVAVFCKNPPERVRKEDFGYLRRAHAGGFEVARAVAKEDGLAESSRNLVGEAALSSVGQCRNADQKKRARVPAGFDRSALREKAQPVVEILRHAFPRGGRPRDRGEAFREDLRGRVGPEQEHAFDPVKENPVRMRSAKEPRSFAHGLEPRLLHPVRERRTHARKGGVRVGTDSAVPPLPEDFKDGVANESLQKLRFVRALRPGSGAALQKFRKERVVGQPPPRSVGKPAKIDRIGSRGRSRASSHRKKNVSGLRVAPRLAAEGSVVRAPDGGERKAEERLVAAPAPAARLHRQVREPVFSVGQGREKNDRLPAFPMPTSRDGIEREPEDPGVEPAKRRQGRLEPEKKEAAPARKRFVAKVGEVFDEGGPGEKRRKKMRFKERPVGRGEKHPLQRFSVPCHNRDGVDGRPDGTAFVVRRPRVLRKSFDVRAVDADEARETVGHSPTGDEVGAERPANGRFSCGVEFGYRHEQKLESGPLRPGFQKKSPRRRGGLSRAGFTNENLRFRKSAPSGGTTSPR